MRRSHSRRFRIEELEGRYMMAVLHGDYNNNGTVQANDYTVWKSNYGNVGEAIPGDGNNDGIVNAADYTVWRDNLGKTFASVPPDPPQTIAVKASSATSVAINWQASAFTTDYAVQRRQPGVINEFSTIGTNIVGTSFSDNTAVANNVYEYQVLARNGGGNSQPSQPASLTAGQSNLTVFRAQQFHDPENLTLAPIYTPFTKSPVADQDEELTTRGPGIRINFDDDDQNGLPDVADIGFPLEQENDLIEVRVDRLPGQGDLALQVGTDLRVFYTYDKEVRIPLIGGGRTEPLSFTGDSASIFVEWITEGHGTDPLQLVNASSSTLLDTIRFHTFHSAIVVLGGRAQIPADPPLDPDNHGIFRAAIDLYRNEGYDVRMYNENDVDLSGTGVTYDELRNSINNQGYTEVALLGYSYGAGSVYDLSLKLKDESTPPFGEIIQPFTITMTSYIDAIESNTTLSENRRPELSDYHLNQFQQNDRFLIGVATTDSQLLDDDIDVSAFGLNHFTIDDSSDVLDLLKLRVRQKVTR